MRSPRSVISRASRTIFLSVVATAILSACARPPSATVNEGANPFNVDKDVVFRTTYYFRVFDYCVARKLKKGQFDEVVIPLTDSLYRFRMTGKAGSNVSDVKFESGTLMAWEIDPFGAKVEYDPESRRARVITPREVTADARRAAVKRDIYEMLAMYDRLKTSFGKNPDQTSSLSQIDREIKEDERVLRALSTEIQDKIKRFGRLDSGPTDDDAQYVNQSRKPLSDEKRSEMLKAEVYKVVVMAFPEIPPETIQEIVDKGYGADSTVLDSSDPGRPGFVERAAVLTIANAVKKPQSKFAKLLSKDITAEQAVNKFKGIIQTKSARLTQSEEYLAPLFAKSGQPESIQCPDDAPVRRGFQVLGPEGWRTFNQDERLMVAMSSSAEPLISTLKDLSNRVINARDNPSAELLPIVLEQKRLSEADRELNTRGANSEVAPDVLAKSVCMKLIAGTEDEESICDG